MRATLEDWARRVAWLVPSADPFDTRFEPLRYWRGPIWAIVNWMIAHGFAAAGEMSPATTIRGHIRRLIETGGLREYFDPMTGSGAGGTDFSWTAAIYLLLEREAAAAA